MADRERPCPRAGGYNRGGLYPPCKRGLDVVFSLLGLVLLSPLLAAVAAAVALTGPVLYRHRRVGKGGAPFTLYKFRTMAPGADGMLESLPQPLQDEFARTFKLQKDPRATRLGAFLRKTSLDELPQLFNVLRGEMSLVGPRPVVDEELAFYGPRAQVFLSVPPGLTGYWQVQGRSATTYAQRVEMELYYVQNSGLLLDAKVLLLTAGAVFGRRGAA